MSRWQPFLFNPEAECENRRRQSWEKPKSNHVYFKTYRELKKALPDYIRKSYNIPCHHDELIPYGIVTVIRSRRGEWGEWFEKWKLEGGKLVKVKEGWM